MPLVTITLTVDSTEAPDILAALEGARFGVQIAEWVNLLPADYDTLPALQRFKAQLRGLLISLTRQYRLEKAHAAITVSDPGVT